MGKVPVQAIRLSSPVAVDGVLDEPVWQNGQAISNFTQRDPDEGAPPSQRTEVRIAYDDDALYVGARLYDTAPDSILARLTRRDWFVPGDQFALFLDPLHDKRSGYYFMMSAAGTQFDGTLLNDSWDDDSWDGVWEGKAKVDSLGWTAEMRIPYTAAALREQGRGLHAGASTSSACMQRRNEDRLRRLPAEEGLGLRVALPGPGRHRAHLGASARSSSRPTSPARRRSCRTRRAIRSTTAASSSRTPASTCARASAASSRWSRPSNPGLRPGRGRPRGGQPLRRRDVLSRRSGRSSSRARRTSASASRARTTTGASTGPSRRSSTAAASAARRRARRPTPTTSTSPPARRSSAPRSSPASCRRAGTWARCSRSRATRTATLSGNPDGLTEFTVEPGTFYGVMRAQKEFPNRKQGLGLMVTDVARGLDQPS